MTRTRRCCFRRDAAKERRTKYIVNLNRSFDSIDSRDATDGSNQPEFEIIAGATRAIPPGCNPRIRVRGSPAL